MKKIFSLLMAIAMLVSVCALFAACTQDNDVQDDQQGGSNVQSDASDFKVGAIYINGKNDTAGYTYAHSKGINAAIAALGIPAENLFVVDNVKEDTTEVSKAIDTLAAQDCDIIFGISFGYGDAFKAAAEKEEYADIIFSHATGYMSNDTNFNNYFGRIYQARYLSGIAAGLKAKELGNNNIGYVSAYGTEYAETCSGINAFTLGAQSVNPDVVVHVKKINTWGDEALERQAAEALVDTYNCCVIAQHCDSAQPQLVAQAKGVFGCGYNSDMTEQAPDAHLTATIWNWEVYYEAAMAAAMQGKETFMKEIGIYYEGLASGLVGISPLSKNCVEGTDKMIALVEDLIKEGSWDVFSGVKLSFNQDGDTYTVVKTDADLVDIDGNVIVKAGEGSVEDAVIKGSMNYYVQGVVAEE